MPRPTKPVIKRRVQVSLTLSPELVTKIDHVARQEDQTRSRIVDAILKQYFKTDGRRAA